mmetsp:Transcript_31282/g.71559  ORF Transcript_31282/g.71559 Transcript_31282/m.71559 type:complete len:242 (+) Transcript_31282:1417-2142(+)
MHAEWTGRRRRAGGPDDIDGVFLQVVCDDSAVFRRGFDKLPDKRGGVDGGIDPDTEARFRRTEFTQIVQQLGHSWLSLPHEGPMVRIELHLCLSKIPRVGPQPSLLRGHHRCPCRPPEPRREPAPFEGVCDIFAQVRVVRGNNASVPSARGHDFAEVGQDLSRDGGRGRGARTREGGGGGGRAHLALGTVRDFGRNVDAVCRRRIPFAEGDARPVQPARSICGRGGARGVGVGAVVEGVLG